MNHMVQSYFFLWCSLHTVNPIRWEESIVFKILCYCYKCTKVLDLNSRHSFMVDITCYNNNGNNVRKLLHSVIWSIIRPTAKGSIFWQQILFFTVICPGYNDSNSSHLFSSELTSPIRTDDRKSLYHHLLAFILASASQPQNGFLSSVGIQCLTP